MVCQEPTIQGIIWSLLNHYCYRDAIFLAERFYAEVSNDEALFLLATSFYRSGKLYQAYTLLKKKGCPTSQCRYLMAQICHDISKLSEAETFIAGSVLSKNKSADEIINEFAESSPYALRLLGNIYRKTERRQQASEQYKQSLKLNPFLWTCYENLCHIGESPDPSKTFNFTNLKNSDVSSPHQINTYVHNNQEAVHNNQNIIHHSVQTPQVLVTSHLVSPQYNSSQLITPNNNNVSQMVTPDCLNRPVSPPTMKRQIQRTLRQGRGFLNSSSALSPLTPSVLPLEASPPSNYITPPTENTNLYMDDVRKCYAPAPSARKMRKSSTYLKENKKQVIDKQCPKIVKFSNPKAPIKKTKTRTSKSNEELNEKNLSDTELAKLSINNPNSIIHSQHRKSTDNLFSLLLDIGKAYSALCQYECSKAIQLFSNLPSHHYHTGWIMSQVGRAYFEMGQYQKAEKVFSSIRQMDPHHVEGMDIYSTALWHLQREVQLSSLANDLTQLDHSSPEAWCATGNCFSLQKEHDVAIRFFQRAIQVSPYFAYAYTLLGHEYVFTEELDKAITCFRNAIRVEPRHYNGWYGIGMIYYKQEKFGLAEVHFKKALNINSHSSVLLCHIGVVQHALQKSESALVTLNKAIAANPKNPLCKFHRASILFSTDKHKDALKELEELKQIVPKESLVYFLMGKVHKKLGNTHLALMNFSWAMDLDPKGANNQIKEAIDKRYVTEEDDFTQGLDEPSSANETINPSNNNSSLMESEDVQLQAIESDESF